MFEAICITGEERKGFFEKEEIREKEISFDREEVLVREVTVKTKKGKIRRKTAKKLEKIYGNKENIYTSVDGIKHIEKNKNNERLMNYLPSVAFRKWANLNGISLADEEFALVVGEGDSKEKEKIFKIAACVKLMTIYGCSDSSLQEEILEKTGLSAKLSDGEIKERAVIYTGDGLAFFDGKTGSRAYDLFVELPSAMKEYSHLPMERVLENALKRADGEKHLKKNKLKIGGFYREQVQ